MKWIIKKFGLFTCLALLNTNIFAQQWGGKIKFYGGVTLQAVKVSGSVDELTETWDNFSLKDTLIHSEIKKTKFIPGLSFNLKIPIWQIYEKFSVGNNAELKIGGLGDSYGVVFFVNVPYYLTFRYGASSTKKNTSRVGIAMGIGPQLSYYYLGTSTPHFSTFFIKPAAMLEFLYQTDKGWHYGISINSLITAYHDVKGEEYRHDEYWKNIGITIFLRH